MWRIRCLAAAVALLLVGVGCGRDRDPAAVAPTFTVRGNGDPITLRAWTFCNGTMCADGMPPDKPPSVGNPKAVAVRFSEPGWTLTAEFQTPDDSCSRSYSVPLTRTDEGGWTLNATGPAGTHHVTLGANGNPYGSAVATFAWTNPAKATFPAPEAHLLTDHFELHLSNLATTPKQGRLAVTVTSADGRTTTLRPEHRPPYDSACPAVGRSYFTVGESVHPWDLDFGAPPLSYDVRLRLDGIDYRATAVSPRDEKFAAHPYVALTFDPPLPAFTG
jgi:hypothetical protein